MLMGINSGISHTDIQGNTTHEHMCDTLINQLPEECAVVLVIVVPEARVAVCIALSTFGDHYVTCTWRLEIKRNH